MNECAQQQERITLDPLDFSRLKALCSGLKARKGSEDLLLLNPFWLPYRSAKARPPPCVGPALCGCIQCNLAKGKHSKASQTPRLCNNVFITFSI